MMKYFVFAALSMVILAIILFLYSPVDSQKTTTPTARDTTTQNKSSDTNQYAKEVAYDGHTYKYYYKKITNTDRVILIPNFDDRVSSSALTEKNNCSFGINGGFYREDGNPLGFFYTNGTTYGHKIDSPTFNGFLAKEKHSQILKNLRMLDESDIEDRYEFALQSGPYFDLAASIFPSFIDKDYARRSLVAETVGGDIYFFIIYDKESRYAGPRLEDIPKLFINTNISKIANFESVLNLDGGSASAYNDKNSGITIKELMPIGSYLCGEI